MHSVVGLDVINDIRADSQKFDVSSCWRWETNTGGIIPKWTKVRRWGHEAIRYYSQ